jgi:hypothetical protein
VSIKNFSGLRDNRCAKVPFLDLGGAYRDLKEEFYAAYRGVMDSSRYILGQELERFESEFSAHLSGAYANHGYQNGWRPRF